MSLMSYVNSYHVIVTIITTSEHNVVELIRNITIEEMYEKS